MNKMHWKILEQEKIYQNERGITLEKQKVSLPDGTVLQDYYQIKMRDFVTMVIKDSAQNYLCIRQYKHGMRKVALTFPGGLIENDEAPLETAARELLEETGYICYDMQYMGKFVLSGNQHICYSHIIAGYGAEKISDATNPDQENGQICLISAAEIKNALFANEFPIISHALAVGMVLSCDN